MPTEYLYVAWFGDDAAQPTDQDAEWVACIMISADSPEDARVWGDFLADGFCTRNPRNRLLRSSVTADLADAGDLNAVPHIQSGQHASDDVIGW